ncbi:MAG TPA: carboxypeptidase-like regulatory domain-containing protein [Bacteroidales bacterium]|nr:carboxypeptidase-like regulatory domain-containing protein [Bacteroidales bacterium]HPT09182.1 carboxypeptidase-like regulatory domain-containing protein [Bacteroidales bacterium]
MKKFTLFILILLAFSSVAVAQQGRLMGKVTEMTTDAPVPNATVTISPLSLSIVTTDDGFFEFKNVPFGKYTLSVSSAIFEPFSIQIAIDRPEVKMEPVHIKRKTADTEAHEDISTITLDLEDENKDQSVSGLLRASEDIFVSTAGYTFGSMFFRARGYDSENSSVMINGYDASDAENGRVVWSNWGGLNDAMRNKEVYYGLNPENFSFSSIGGSTYINTRASQYRKQLKVSYALTNRTYTNRLMVTYSSGQLPHGWAITVSGSRRWAEQSYIKGTFYDAWSYFASLEKKFGKNHSLNLTVYGAPTQRGQQSATVQEVYDLTGTNYYNPNWGYQNGEKRNAKVKNFHEPVFLLNHFWDISEKIKLSTAVGYTFGKDKWSALNWYNAADPRPDYYRYLPSYQTDPVIRQLITQQWQNESTVNQIDWNKLYQINYLSNLEGKQSRYIIENNVTQTDQFYFNSHVNADINDHVTVSGGLNFRLYKAGHYKEMSDLLGGNYWVDIDQFAERDFPGDSTIVQNDLNNPNRVIKVGDKFGYNYDAHINTLNLWAQGQFTYNKFDFYVAGSLTGTEFWRTGNMRNGRHPNSSYGDSPKYDFLNFGVRGGFTYKFSGRHYANINGLYLTRAPYFTNSFISARVRNDIVPDLSSEKIFGGDISYTIRYPWLFARVTYYYTRFLNQTEINSFYHDDYRTYVNYILRGVDKQHQGIELGVEVKATKFMSVYGVASIGDYIYTNRPTGTISFDNGSRPDTTGTVYLKNFYVPTTPQTALSAGLKFNYKYWFFDVNGNFYDNGWLDFNPERRTQLAIKGLGPEDPLIKTITEQQELKGGFTLDASLGKSFRIKSKVYLNVNFSVTNILNNTNIQSGGFEQNRFDFDTKDISKFPPKYYYYYGRTFYLNIGIRI